VSQHCRRFISDEAASSATEYVIITALVAAAMILISDAARVTAKSSFLTASAALDYDLAGSPAAAPSTGKSVAGAAKGRPVLTAAAIRPSDLLAGSVLLAAAAVLGYGRYRRRMLPQAVEQIDCPGEPPLDSPSNPQFAKRQEIQRVLLRHFDDAIENRIEVRHVMSRQVRIVKPRTPLSDLCDLMESEGVHHLLVMRQGALVGVISDRDIQSRSGHCAADVMTPSPCTVAPGDHIGPAITVMLLRRISCLPVVEKGQLCGILTTSDMLMTLQCLMQLLERSHAGEEFGAAAKSRTISEACQQGSAPRQEPAAC
jgi:CBS domain-containing protein